MSDHHHGYADQHHDHRGQYADDRHGHDDCAERHHRHYDLESRDKTAQQAITCLRGGVAGLRRDLDDALKRIHQLEAEHQADVQSEARDLREAGTLAWAPGRLPDHGLSGGGR
jgi:hypothetical protein